MSYFLCKSIPFVGPLVRPSQPTTSILGFLPNPGFFPRRWVSTSSDQQSFTVSYLVKSHGFSPKYALSVSKYVNLKNPEKADNLVNLFKEHGFTQIQISKLVRANPKLLLYNAEKTLLPKLEFFETKGISVPEVAKMLSSYPTVLASSLDKQIIPTYDFFRSFFHSDEKLFRAVKRCADILTVNIEKNVSPNFDILREHGVPDSNIATLMLYQPKSVVVKKPDRFREIVKKVEDMGFESSKVNFVLAIQAFLQMSESTWQSKVDAYKKWGWSEEDVLYAFRKFPWCMMLSVEKLVSGMDFFINQMGMRPNLIAKQPILLSLSLKKRIIPRFSVFQVLLSKALVKKEVSLLQLFKVSDKTFLQNFVKHYDVEAPELLKLYKEKLNLSYEPLDDKL